MFKITEYVKASDIWQGAEDYIDEGLVPGLVRGYNIEFKTDRGGIGWESCAWIEGDPEDYFNDEFHTWLYDEHGWTPTGRICFRGYGEQEYDPVERDYYIVNIGNKEGRE